MIYVMAFGWGIVIAFLSILIGKEKAERKPHVPAIIGTTLSTLLAFGELHVLQFLICFLISFCAEYLYKAIRWWILHPHAT